MLFFNRRCWREVGRIAEANELAGVGGRVEVARGSARETAPRVTAVANADGRFGRPLPPFSELIERGAVCALNFPV